MTIITNCYFDVLRTSAIASHGLRSSCRASIAPSDFFSCRLFKDDAGRHESNAVQIEFLKSRFATMRLRRGETRRRLFDNMEMKMSETIQVLRDGRNLIGATDLVHSPDDEGYYFSQADFAKSKRRVSAKVYRSETAAKKAWSTGTVEWESWY
jgi:hypothetical protein